MFEVIYGVAYLFYAGLVLSWLGATIVSRSGNPYICVVVSIIALLVPFTFGYIDRWLCDLKDWQTVLVMVVVYVIPVGSMIVYEYFTGVDIPDVVYGLVICVFCTCTNLYVVMSQY